MWTSLKSLVRLVPSSSPGSRREPTCMRVQWPEASRRTLWQSKRWRGPPASSTLWPSLGNQRQRRTTRGSITFTVTRCLWDWRRKRRREGQEQHWDQRNKLSYPCRRPFRSTPTIQTAASFWTLRFFTCSFREWERGAGRKKLPECQNVTWRETPESGRSGLNLVICITSDVIMYSYL